jgi:hypothetical protein
MGKESGISWTGDFRCSRVKKLRNSRYRPPDGGFNQPLIKRIPRKRHYPLRSRTITSQCKHWRDILFLGDLYRQNEFSCIPCLVKGGEGPGCCRRRLGEGSPAPTTMVIPVWECVYILTVGNIAYLLLKSHEFRPVPRHVILTAVIP